MPGPYVLCPFLIACDSNEGHPFSFTGMISDAHKKNCEYIVDVRWMSLGRYPDSYGDYSIPGLEQEVAVERKSMEDVWSTVMGWETEEQKEKGLPSRRKRFESELENLSSLPASVVVVEAELGEILASIPDRGSRDPDTNRKMFFRSLISFQQRFKVPWMFAPGRRTAETWTFRWLMRYWEKLPKKRRIELARTHSEWKEAQPIAL